MIWERQIGAMTQELSVAFAVVSLAYGALYMADRREPHLWLAGTALFMAITTHAIALVVCGIGFAMLILAGAVAAAWTSRTLVRLVVVGLVATVAANLYFVIGFLQGQGLALSFFLYDPRNVSGYTGTGADAAPAAVGQELSGNLIFQLAFIGALAAVAIGLVVAWRKKAHGAALAGFALPVVALMLFYDLIAVRFGVLFRVRQAWITGELLTAGLGLGVGALVMLAAALSEVEDPLWDRLRGALRVKRAGLELGALVLAVVLLLALFPRYSAVARIAGPSGYPNATEVSLDIIRSEDRLKFTFVGLSEQFQEAYSIGQFVEAWVFAKDITFGQARDPGYEVPIPTDRVYLFVEKTPFPGPQSLWWGPTEEYYRTHIKRQRIMDRIRAWAETYSQFHGDMTVHYSDAEIVVYKVDRAVDLGRASLDPAFKGPSYEYNAGWYFHSDADVTADRIEPDRDALPQRSCEGYGEPCFPAEVIREQVATGA